MTDKQSTEDETSGQIEGEETPCQLREPDPISECCSDKKNTASAKTFEDKATSIDMDGEPGDDEEKTKKYWQDVAGFRGAREQYLQMDVRDLRGDKYRQDDYIKYLQEKLDRVLAENMVLKARRCRCDEDKELELELVKNKTFSSFGL